MPLLLLLLCSFFSCVLLFMEEGMATFYRWRRGGPWKMPPLLMESTKPPPNRLVGALNLAVTNVTIMGKAVSFNRQKMGQNRAATSEPKRAHFWWACSTRLPDMGHGGASRRFGDLVWVWPHSPLCLGPNLSSNGPRSFGLVWNGICACSFTQF
jgi:hypothetical protein